MGRHRLHLDNAARQRAYRERENQKHLPAPVIVPDYFDHARETDGQSWTLRSFVQDVINDGVSVAYVAQRLNVGRKVISAWLLPPSFPQANSSPATKVSVAKKLGRPRIWADDKHRKHAHYMRHLARSYNWGIGFWADDAKRVDAIAAKRENRIEIRNVLRITLPFPAPRIGAGRSIYAQPPYAAPSLLVATLGAQVYH